MTTEVTNRLLRSFVILDISKMEGATFQQVGDYVAMVALAQIDPDADTASFDTVMNLFDQPRHAETLTDWDQAYLRALYGAYLNERNPNAQLGSVGSVMVRDRRAAERAGRTPAPRPWPRTLIPRRKSPTSPNSDPHGARFSPLPASRRPPARVPTDLSDPALT